MERSIRHRRLALRHASLSRHVKPDLHVLTAWRVWDLMKRRETEKEEKFSTSSDFSFANVWFLSLLSIVIKTGPMTDRRLQGRHQAICLVKTRVVGVGGVVVVQSPFFSI